MLHTHTGAALLQIGERRLDQGRTQTFARDQRPASAAADRKRLADDGAGKPRRSIRRIDIECRKEKRLDQALVERAFAGDDFAHRLAGRRPQKPRQRQIVEHAGSRHPPLGIEDPEWNRPVVEAQRPTRTACEIGEGKLGARRTNQLRFGADAAQIPERGVIAGQQQMVAVVDRHADRCIVIRTAAAAREGGRFVHHDGAALRCEPHRGGKAGEAGADDVSCSAHHTRLRKTMRRSFAFGSFTGARGGTKPRAISFSRMM